MWPTARQGHLDALRTSYALNGDGKLDIVMTNFGVVVFLNTCK